MHRFLKTEGMKGIWEDRRYWWTIKLKLYKMESCLILISGQLCLDSAVVTIENLPFVFILLVGFKGYRTDLGINQSLKTPSHAITII